MVCRTGQLSFPGRPKRALLTAYADTDAAIRAVNSVQIDHYLMKPWDPPEERLYGVVDDLLDDWLASYHPAFEGARVIGHRWSPRSNEIRDFLGRNFVPHQWLNVEADETAKQLLSTTGAGVSSLPLAVFADGSFLGNPPIAEIARKLALKTKAEFPFYDLVAVGPHPARGSCRLLLRLSAVWHKSPALVQNSRSTFWFGIDMARFKQKIPFVCDDT